MSAITGRRSSRLRHENTAVTEASAANGRGESAHGALSMRTPRNWTTGWNDAERLSHIASIRTARRELAESWCATSGASHQGWSTSTSKAVATNPARPTRSTDNLARDGLVFSAASIACFARGSASGSS